MIVILGLVILVAAVIAGAAGVLANGSHAHAVTHFAVFGYHVTGSTGTLFLYGIAAQAAMIQKDYPDAITYYQADLTLKPDDPIVEYNLGKAELASTGQVKEIPELAQAPPQPPKVVGAVGLAVKVTSVPLA